MATLEAITYKPGSLSILDQLLLPHTTTHVSVRTAEDGHNAIRSMQVRGAPAIAMVGILSLAVEIESKLRHEITDAEQAVQTITQKLDYIVQSRPTAVHLRNMADDFKSLSARAAADTSSSVPVFEAYLTAAAATLEQDLQENRRLARHGADFITKHAAVGGTTHHLNVLTHCNTGALATAGVGTALGVIRSLHSLGGLERAYYTETRPYNQGARLTAYELVYENIPSTMITDSMAAALMASLKARRMPLTAVVVGADRIAANGDTANKIGTYSLALSARAHGVLFLVAALCSSVDVKIASGKDIKIETRPASEVTTVSGPVCDVNGVIDRSHEPKKIRVAAENVEVWNPAFDVTPAKFIDGIVTEKGVATKASGKDEYDMAAWCDG